MTKYYEYLGLNTDCNDDEIKNAFINKLKSMSKLEKEYMLPFAKAYVVLINPAERKKYDAAGWGGYDFAERNPSVSDPDKLCDSILEEAMFFEKNLHADFISSRRDILMGAAGVIVGVFLFVIITLVFLFYSARGLLLFYVIVVSLIVSSFGILVKGCVLLESALKRKKDKINLMWKSIDFI